jgi:Uma2 family endonuclease
MTRAVTLTREVPVARLDVLDRGRARHAKSEGALPRLECGDCLTRDEFERRYAAMPGDTKFELIDGIVYMASPVKEDHDSYQLAVSSLLRDYAFATPGCKAGLSPTIRLGRKDEPQPDGLLRLLPEVGGRSRVDRDGYLSGPVELVVEVASSSEARDLNQKKRAYLSRGVLEYVVIVISRSTVIWFRRRGRVYVPSRSDRAGILRSKVFPGLWLHGPALVHGDEALVRSTLEQGTASPEHAGFVRELERRRRRDPAGR